ncbi:hypothetical protein LXL04_007315 [Taraxacum kok-saghyz]
MKIFFVFLFGIVTITRSGLGLRLDTNFQTTTTIPKHYNISINDVGLWALGFECRLKGDETISHLINPGDESIIEFQADDNDGVSVPCVFYWSKQDMHIHVFDQSLKKQCGDDLVNTCRWKISIDGFYVYDGRKRTEHPTNYS